MLHANHLLGEDSRVISRKIWHAFCHLQIILSKSTFSRNSFNASEFQAVWIWVQTVCKGYQQTTLVGKELKNGAATIIVH